MPFANRIIEPLRPSTKHWDKNHDKDLDTITNNSLSGVLLQLSSLARAADEIFCEVTQECHAVVNRTDRLKNRVTLLVDNVTKLDAKAVKVPEADLKTFSKVNQHHKIEHGYDCYLFTPAGRPDCIGDLYEAAAVSPIKTIRKCNVYRTDGKSGSQIFSLTPVLQDEKFSDPESLQVQSKPAQVPIAERVTKQPKKVRPKSLSAIVDIDVTAQTEESVLPTPEEKLRAMSRSQPVALVPIDVSGSGFVRLCENRASQRSIGREYIAEPNKTMPKKRGRRKTVSGIPGHVMDEVNGDYFKVSSGDDLRTRSASRERWERPRSVAMDTYAPRSDKKKYKEKRRGRSLELLDVDDEDDKLARSCSLRRSLRSLFKGKRSKSTDLWADGHPASPGPPVIDLGMPLTRSKSLPRSLKNLVKNTVSRFSQSRSASTEGRLDFFSEDETDSSRQSTLSRKKSKSKKKDVSRSMSVHSSLPHSSTFTEGSIGISRPKSLDFRTASLDRRRHPVPVSTPVSPSADSVSSAATSPSVESTVTAAGAQHVHVDIPSKPWTKPFAKVKLRGPMAKLDKDERQSSSGNWSGSSNSARQSLESEYARSSVSSPERRSQQSDKDSAVSLNNYGHHDESLTIHEDDTLQDDDTSTICGEGASTPTESVVDVKENFTKLSTDEWLKVIKHKKGRGISQDGTIQSTTSQSSNDSSRTLPDALGNGLTVRNVQAHDNLHKPVSNYRPKKYLGDDESSIYSVDEQGFFTSMHKDCGVQKSNVDLSEIDNETSQSQFSSNSTMNSCVDKNKSGRKGSFLSKFSSLKRDKKKKKTPPPPPPRISAVLSKSNLELDEFPAPDTPPLTTPTEIRKLADLAQKIADRKQVESERRAKLEADMKSSDISYDTENREAEVIYARLKMKTAITSSAIPAMCSITPCQSDEEDGDMIEFSSAWRPNGFDSSSQSSSSLKSSNSTPASLEEMKSTTSVNSNESQRPFLRMESIMEDSHEQLLNSSKDDMVLDTSKHDSSAGDSDLSGFSTWPRSPTNKGEPKVLESILKTGGVKKTKSRGKVPLTINVADGVDIYGTNTGAVDLKSTIPGVKTPEDTLDIARTFACAENNSFRVSDPSGPVLHVASSRPVGMSMLATSVSQQPSHVYADIVVSSAPSKPVCPPAILSMARANKQTDYQGLSLEGAGSSRTLPPGTFTGQPMPATARLIISSPVANRACFVENPHKRSLCSPVTDEDLLKYQSYNSSDKWYNTLPRKPHPPPLETSLDGPDKNDGPRSPNLNALPRSFTAFEFRAEDTTLNPLPESSVNSSRSMKHSSSFPAAKKEKDVPSTYGRTWYDGIDANSTVVEEKVKPIEEERPKMSFSSFLRDQPPNNLSVPFTPRRDSTASTLSSNSSSSGKKSVSFASLHKNSMSSLATRSSDCSSSISGGEIHLIGHRTSVPETETVAIVPGGSMKRSTSLSESNSQPLLTFSAPAVDSKELSESNGIPPVVSLCSKSSEPKQKGPPKPYSTQRPRHKSQPASIITTSFVGSEIQNSDEPSSNNAENQEFESGDKKSKDNVICAKPPAGKVGLSNTVNQTSARAVVSYTDSRPVKGGKGTTDSKIIISAKGVKTPKPKAVVSIDSKALSDGRATPTPPGSASSTLTRHCTPPGSNSNSLKRDGSLPGSAFSSLKRLTSSGNGKAITTVTTKDTPLSTTMPGKGTMVNVQPVTKMAPHVQEKSSSVNDKLADSGGKIKCLPANSSSSRAGLQTKSCSAGPPVRVMAKKPTVLSPGKPSDTISPSSTTVSPNVNSNNAKNTARTSSFSQSKSAFSFEVAKPSPPKFVLPSVRGWLPGPLKKDPRKNTTTVNPSQTESGSEHCNNPITGTGDKKNIGGVFSPANKTGSEGSKQVVDSSRDKDIVRRRDKDPSKAPENRQNRWSIADMSSDHDFVALSTSNLNSSMASLAKSTESLASNSSLSERNRFRKFSFLNSQEDVSAPKGDFESRFEMHKKKLSASRTSLNSMHSNPGGKSKDLSASKTSLTIEEKNSSPVQGRFVSSLINQFQKPSMESLSSPTTTTSSGLGPSLPSSPISTPASPSASNRKNDHTNTTNNNVNGKIQLDRMAMSCVNNRSSSLLPNIQHETSIH